ncbi:MAG: DUF5683 domain-containing protein [Rikenellaceae bacterium]
MSSNLYRAFLSIAVLLALLDGSHLMANEITTRPLVIRGGQMVPSSEPSSEEVVVKGDSLAMVAADSLQVIAAEQTAPKEEHILNVDSLAKVNAAANLMDEGKKRGFLSDSMSLSGVSWASAVLPGFGQVYNKQYWKLPILYGALAAGITLYVKENQRYKPLKSEYDAYTEGYYLRDPYLDELQSSMIRSNTRRQLYLGATIGTYLYSIGDAAVNYATNNVSGVKRATTLATICPGAGQIYNKSYWKVPFVVGGFASLIYVLDWNNRGYKRFKKAYVLTYEYENSENQAEEYPSGSLDEFGGRYSADYLKDIRDSYRRNRDLSIIFLAGLYIFQIIDAHVDAHFKDFDVSDDLAMTIDPMIDYAYSPINCSDNVVFGFNIGFKF